MITDRVLIAALNDAFRRTFVGGAVVLTSAVANLDKPTRRRIMEAVQNFDEFTSHNDPHGEHDFGMVKVSGHTIFFKIDYYAHDLKHGSEDPADASKTRRVMTIMFASEY